MAKILRAALSASFAIAVVVIASVDTIRAQEDPAPFHVSFGIGATSAELNVTVTESCVGTFITSLAVF